MSPKTKVNCLSSITSIRIESKRISKGTMPHPPPRICKKSILISPKFLSHNATTTKETTPKMNWPWSNMLQCWISMNWTNRLLAMFTTTSRRKGYQLRNQRMISTLNLKSRLRGLFPEIRSGKRESGIWGRRTNGRMWSRWFIGSTRILDWKLKGKWMQKDQQDVKIWIRIEL